MGLDEMVGFHRLRCDSEFMRVDYTGPEPAGEYLPNHECHRRGEMQALAPVMTFKRRNGRIGDYLDDEASFTFGLLSDKFAQLLRMHGVSGYNLLPATVQVRKGVVKQYHSLIITGRCELALSKYQKTIVAPYLRRPLFPKLPSDIPKEELRRIQYNWLDQRETVMEEHRIGFYFEPESWDGSDFFCSPEMTSFLLCTQRVKDIVDQHDLTGCDFWPLDEFDWDVRSLNPVDKST